MSTALIYDNPECSKCRATLALLRERGIEPTIVEYLKSPPSAAQLTTIADLLGTDLRGLLRRGDAAYAELDLDNPQLDNNELLRRVLAQPTLLQRPIVLANGKAAIGRPPEAILAILAP